jgi:hypothetical protein
MVAAGLPVVPPVLAEAAAVAAVVGAVVAAVVDALVETAAAVGVELELPQAASKAAIVGAARPRAAARFRTWRRVSEPEIAWLYNVRRPWSSILVLLLHVVPSCE